LVNVSLGAGISLKATDGRIRGHADIMDYPMPSYTCPPHRTLVIARRCLERLLCHTPLRG
jgi:hypothetical protein